MNYELGVLLYHCTIYGKVDFDIQTCVKSIINNSSYGLNIEEIKNSFIVEAMNHMEPDLIKRASDSSDGDVEIADNLITELFIPTWNALAPEQHQIKKKIFKISITETLNKVVEIEENDLASAIMKAERLYYEEKIVLDSDDFVDADFEEEVCDDDC